MVSVRNITLNFKWKEIDIKGTIFSIHDYGRSIYFKKQHITRTLQCSASKVSIFNFQEGWRKECPRFDFHTPVSKCLKLGAPAKFLEKNGFNWKENENWLYSGIFREEV